MVGKEALKELGPQQWRSTFLALGSIAGSVHFANVAQKEKGNTALRRYAWGCSVIAFASFLTFAFEGSKQLFLGSAPRDAVAEAPSPPDISSAPLAPPPVNPMAN